MRLGAPVFGWRASEEWALAHVAKGYGAAYWPLGPDADEKAEREFTDAAKRHNLVIAEVGAWCNMLDPDPVKRENNLRYVAERLACAERVGARCCVNISGSHDAQWDAPHPDNLTDATFRAVVENARRVLDESGARNTRFSYEPMPWMYPTDAGDTLRLIEAIDRPAFGVHVDMANLMNTPERVYRCTDFTRAYFAAVGGHIRSIHAKDTRLLKTLTTHIEEALPGEGMFDFGALLTCAAKLDDVPVMLEHLATEAEYDRAGAHLCAVADALGLAFTKAN